MNIMLIGNGFDLQHDIKITFKDFVESDIFKQGIGKSYKKFFTEDEYKKYSGENMIELWSDFEGYLMHIISNNNLKHDFFIKKITCLFQKWFKNIEITIHRKEKDKTINKIITNNNIKIIISLNYTSTPEIYGFKKKIFNKNALKSEWTDIEKMKGKFINIHWYDKNEKKLHCILGNDSSNKISKEKYIELWDKGEKFNPKKFLLQTILEKQDQINKIFIYGFSFGNSDKDINDFLVQFYKTRSQEEVIFYFDKKNNTIKKTSINKSLDF